MNESAGIVDLVIALLPLTAVIALIAGIAIAFKRLKSRKVKAGGIILIVISFVMILAVLSHHYEYAGIGIITSLATTLAAWAIIALPIVLLVAAIKLGAGKGAIIAIIASLIIIFALLGFLSYQLEGGSQGGEVTMTVILIAGLVIWIAYIFRGLYLRNKRLSERGAEQGLTEIKSLKDQF
jgi:uncharacterized membrane protein YhaH (DUF805 family)